MVGATPCTAETAQTVSDGPTILLLVTLAVAAAAHGKLDRPIAVWNVSASAPIGLYLVSSRRPEHGELAVLRLPDSMRRLADARGYLAHGALLIKRIAASGGDTVCRHGPLIRINGRPRASARTADRLGRLLPRWSGCRHLGRHQQFLLSASRGSFDSRYFGPIDSTLVLGTARAL